MRSVSRCFRIGFAGVLAFSLTVGIRPTPVVAAVAPVSDITSPTHPLEDVWYDVHDPEFEWAAVAELPQCLGSYDTSGSALAVAVAGDVAYVADGGAGLASFDISDPASPVPLGSYDTSGSALAVAVAGDIAYVADGDAGLAVIDISDPSSPGLLDWCDTPGSASSLVVCGDTVYVADADAGLAIIDTSDPTDVAPISTYDTAGSAVGIAHFGQRVCVADSEGGLLLIDVSDPATPGLLGSCDTTGSAVSVATVGHLAYVADGDAGLLVVDISDPVHPVLSSGLDTKGSAVGVALVGDSVCVADSDGGIAVIDVSSPAAPVLLGSHETGGAALGAVVAGDVAYVVTGVGLETIAISQPDTVTSIGSCDTPGEALGVTVAGDIALVADGTGGLQIADISDPRSPGVIGNLDEMSATDPVVGVDIWGDQACVVRSASILMVDISDPASPGVLGRWDVPQDGSWVSVRDVRVRGGYAYVAAGTKGLAILDVSDPSAPALVGVCDTPGLAFSVDVHGDIVYVADSGDIVIVDASDITDPVVVDAYGCEDARGIVVDGDTAYVVDVEGDLLALDIADPTAPVLAGSLSAEAGERFYRLALSGDAAYVSAGLSDGAKRSLYALDVSEPAAIEVVGSWDCSMQDEQALTGVAVSGDVVYIAETCGMLDAGSGSLGLRVLDVGHGPVGYSWAFDQDPEMVPDTTIDGLEPATGFTDVDAGRWYFHVRAVGEGRNASAVAHRSVRIGDSAAVVPIQGDSRYETAIAISKKAFPTGVTATVDGYRNVIIATGRNWPDALGGASLAGALECPILLTDPNTLPATVAAEIERLGATRAVVLGGEGAVSAAVYGALDDLDGLSVMRIAGTSRYQTSYDIAEETVRVLEGKGAGFDGTAFIATGKNFPDALGASPIAAAVGIPLYLVDPVAGLTPELEAALQADGVTDVIALGGTAVIPASVLSDIASAIGASTDRWAGSDRYDTAKVVATHGVDDYGLTWDKVAIATGANFPDALAGGALQGADGSVMLLTPSTSLYPGVASTLAANKATISEVRFLGGTGAVSDAVRAAVAAALE